MFPSLNPGHIGITVALREEAARHGAAAIRDLFLQHGLRLGAWNLPFMPYRVTEAEWRDWLARLPPLLAGARALGAARCGMWILPGSDEREFDENFAFHVTRFQPVARLLADHGIRLGLEFIGPETSLRQFKHPFVRSVAGTLELARAVGPNCGLLLDAWHWHAAGGTRADLRELTRHLLVHVHVNDAPAGVAREALIDNRRKLPGATGVIDLDGFMQALADADYDGPVTAEPFDPELSALPAEEAAARTARATRTAVARAV
jgi:sugar phosphate isomerase/epimerase